MALHHSDYLGNYGFTILTFVLTEKILPVVKNQHLLLCTLLICNAAAMEVYMQDYDCMFQQAILALLGYLFSS